MGIGRAVAHIRAAVNPHHHRSACRAHTIGCGPHIQRQAVLALRVERGTVALATRLDGRVAEIFSLAHKAAVGLGPSDLPAAVTRRLQGVGDALEGEQRAVTLTDKDAIGRFYSQRIGIYTFNDLVLATECHHLLFQSRGLLRLLLLLGAAGTQQQHQTVKCDTSHNLSALIEVCKISEMMAFHKKRRQ